MQSQSHHSSPAVKIECRMLEDFLAEYDKSLEPLSNPHVKSSYLSYLNPVSYLKQSSRPSESPKIALWAFQMKKLLARMSGHQVLDGSGLCELFFLLLDSTTEKSLLERGILNAVQELFDKPFGQPFWNYLDKMDQAGLFRVSSELAEDFQLLSVGAQRVSGDKAIYKEVRMQTMPSEGLCTDETGLKLFSQLVSLDSTAAEQVIFIGNVLIKAKEENHSTVEAFRKRMTELLELSPRELQSIARQFQVASDRQRMMPAFWEVCYQNRGLPFYTRETSIFNFASGRVKSPLLFSPMLGVFYTYPEFMKQLREESSQNAAARVADTGLPARHPTESERSRTPSPG